jgi:uncharacterized membrane protein
MSAPAARRTSLDLLRGVAVLVMIEAHVIDSWTRAADRHSSAFAQSLVLGGFGAPLFLLLAGVAVGMSAGSKARRLGDDRAAARMVQRRGLEIFGLAFLFRLQSCILSHGPLWTLLKVDVLNIMGPAIVFCAFAWAVVRTTRARVAMFAILTAAIVFVTPAVRAFAPLAAVPDWVEGYVRPVPEFTNFAIFPWTAFVTAGALLGVLVDAARTEADDRRLHVGLGIGGFLLAGIAYEASFLPALDPRSRFWTTSVSFFCIRLGTMVAAMAALWLWEQRPSARAVPSGQPPPWSPLQLMGRTSLFVYWIHVELVYGLIATPLKGAFSLSGAWAALGVFCTLMLGAAALKQWVVAKYHEDRQLRGKLRRQAQALML